MSYERGTLGQKLGYDRRPYLSFFVRRFEDGIIDLTDRRDLNTKYTNFGPKMLWSARDAGRQRWLD